MTDANGQQLSLDANVLEGTSDGVQITYQTSDGQTVTTLASDNAADIVSKAFTTMAEGSEQNVEYITMTPEEAAAAGVVAAPEEEQQVVTTSLQFDPANPSVLYTADGTPINQADLTPEEQALVQAALQQHLAEQEAEQQIAMMQEQSEGAEQQGEGTAVDETAVDASMVTSTTTSEQLTMEAEATRAATEAVMQAQPTVVTTTTSIDLASPNTSASQIVQSLADSVRKQQLQDQMQTENVPVQKPLLPKSTMRGGEGSIVGGIKYEEKIVIRQGQPQVVKVPVKKKPEIPAALANLMPKVEIGKDGSQVIRIHQSQITPSQLKALQDNPNVRLVFRPAGANRTAGKPSPTQGDIRPRKRGRPRKNPIVPGDPAARIVSDTLNNEELEPDLDDPPAKTRCGRLSKRPMYTRDYLTPKNAQGIEEDGERILDPGDENFLPKSTSPQSPKKPRGRPPGSKGYKRSSSYASKIEALRNQENNDSAISLPSNKPMLTPIEQAISTRRKNRLREMLSACSEDEIMEVAMPHLARVFSLWEFLITKVEKSKMTRVFFADVYKEYECLHKYISKLAEKYKQAIESGKSNTETGDDATKENGVKTENEEKKEGETSEEKSEEEERRTSKLVTVTCKKLAESLGIDTTTLEDAEITLLDAEEAIGPRLMGIGPHGVRKGSQAHKYMEDKNARKPKAYMVPTTEQKGEAEKKMEAVVKATQNEIITTSPTKNTVMPPLKPLGQPAKVPKPVAVQSSGTTVNGAEEAKVDSVTTTNENQMETDASTATPVAEAEAEAMQTEAAEEGTGGTQLIQIGQGEDQQFIEVPEGYTLIQTPEGLVMSQPGTTISQGEDGTIYVTQADGTTTPLNAAQQQGVPLETVESLLALDGQQQPQA